MLEARLALEAGSATEGSGISMAKAALAAVRVRDTADSEPNDDGVAESKGVATSSMDDTTGNPNAPDTGLEAKADASSDGSAASPNEASDPIARKLSLNSDEDSVLGKRSTSESSASEARRRRQRRRQRRRRSDASGSVASSGGSSSASSVVSYASGMEGTASAVRRDGRRRSRASGSSSLSSVGRRSSGDGSEDGDSSSSNGGAGAELQDGAATSSGKPTPGTPADAGTSSIANDGADAVEEGGVPSEDSSVDTPSDLDELYDSDFIDSLRHKPCVRRGVVVVKWLVTTKEARRKVRTVLACGYSSALTHGVTYLWQMQEDDEIVFRERDARNSATRFLSTPEGLQRMKEQVQKRKMQNVVQRTEIKDDVSCVSSCSMSPCTITACWWWCLPYLLQYKRTKLILKQARKDLNEILKRSEMYHDGKDYELHRYNVDLVVCRSVVPHTMWTPCRFDSVNDIDNAIHYARKDVRDWERNFKHQAKRVKESNERRKFKRMDWEAQIRKDMLIHVMRKNEKEVQLHAGGSHMGCTVACNRPCLPGVRTRALPCFALQLAPTMGRPRGQEL